VVDGLVGKLVFEASALGVFGNPDDGNGVREWTEHSVVEPRTGGGRSDGR